MSGGGQGMQTGGGQPPMMGGQPGRPPMMGPGGPGGFREGPYGMPQGMQGNGPGAMQTGGPWIPPGQPGSDPGLTPDNWGGPQPGQMGGQDMRNPMLGGVKGPMGGMLPENFLNMMRQRQQQGLLGGMKTGGLDDTQMPQGVGIGMSPPRMPPQQPGGGNEMAQIMDTQYRGYQ